MQIGDIVNKKPEHGPLHCGSGVYPYAIVISVEPLVLVSESTDMRWSCVDADTLEIIGRAPKSVTEECIRKREKT